MTYAQKTEVTIERSRAEIEHMLERFGATGFMSGWDKEKNAAMISFRLRGRFMRFRLELPDREAPEIIYKKINQSAYREKRTEIQAKAAWDQLCRERWRALALLIKAKLAAVESGIVTMDEEFLSSVLLPDQRTVSEWMQPQVDQAYSTGHMPPLLPLPERD